MEGHFIAFSPGADNVCYTSITDNDDDDDGDRLSCEHGQKLKKGKGRPYSITERRVAELIPVLGSQPAGDVSHKPSGRLPLLSTRPAVTQAALKRAATKFAAW